MRKGVTGEKETPYIEKIYKWRFLFAISIRRKSE